MKRFNKEKGRQGEEAATLFLLKAGYKILQNNFYTKWGEIDIVADDKGQLVFVEVKTRVGDALGTPEEMIDKNKIKKVVKTAQLYLQKNPEVAEKYDSFRLDAVAVVFTPEGEIARVSHYQNLTF
ncbi:MAG: YraN family protein [Patescibacteria group bacterium]